MIPTTVWNCLQGQKESSTVPFLIAYLFTNIFFVRLSLTNENNYPMKSSVLFSSQLNCNKTKKKSLL